MKTRDAFAFQSVADNLAQISISYNDDGRGVLPTYAGRDDTSEKGQHEYLNSYSCRFEEILLAYLDGGKIKRGDYNSLSEFENEYEELKLCKERIKRAKKIVAWISKHVVRLQRYEKKILNMILKSGLSDKLKTKGNRVKILLADYGWLIEVFAGYNKIVLQKDRESLRRVVNQLYRKEFGDRLRQARITKNMTVEDVANKIHLTRVGYGYYELGQRDPPPGAIYILAQMFDVSADWLLGLKK